MKDEFDLNLVQRVINSDLPYSEETDIQYNESKGWSTFRGTGKGELASQMLLPEKNDWSTFRGSRSSERYNKHCYTYTDEYLEEITRGFCDYKGHCYTYTDKYPEDFTRIFRDYKGYMSDEIMYKTILKSINNCNKVKRLKK